MASSQTTQAYDDEYDDMKYSYGVSSDRGSYSEMSERRSHMTLKDQNYNSSATNETDEDDNAFTNEDTHGRSSNGNTGSSGEGASTGKVAPNQKG